MLFVTRLLVAQFAYRRQLFRKVALLFRSLIQDQVLRQNTFLALPSAFIALTAVDRGTLGALV